MNNWSSCISGYLYTAALFKYSLKVSGPMESLDPNKLTLSSMAQNFSSTYNQRAFRLIPLKKAGEVFQGIPEGVPHMCSF